jgi:hypothetical protein
VNPEIKKVIAGIGAGEIDTQFKIKLSVLGPTFEHHISEIILLEVEIFEVPDEVRQVNRSCFPV